MQIYLVVKIPFRMKVFKLKRLKIDQETVHIGLQ